MTGYNDIRDAIISRLKTAYPSVKIHGEKLQQGFLRPAFYVQLLPEPASPLTLGHKQKTLMVVVHYFSDAAANARDRDMWSAADNLDSIFGASLTVGDRSIHIEDTEPEIVDDVLQYQINLSFIDGGDSDGIEVTLDDNTTTIVVPEPELGYVDNKDVVPMRELTIKGV